MDRLQEGLDVPAVGLEEARVEQPPIHDDLGHGPVQGRIAAGTQLEKAVGVLGQSMPPRIDDDELRALQLGPHDPAANGRELQPQVHAVHDDGVARVELGDGVGAGRDAQHG